MKLVLLTVLAIGQILAQTKMQASQVVDLVRNSVKRQSDKEVAEFLKHITLTDRLTDNAIEECITAGAGSRTALALKDLADRSASLPETPKAAPKPKPVGPPPPSKEAQQQVLERVTEYARGYVTGLPNFTCSQMTTRFRDPRNLEQYSKADEVKETLSYSNGQEQYSVVQWNDKLYPNVNHWDLGGTTSSGEFGSDMREIFDPRTATEFEWESWTTWHGRRTHRFFYRVRQPLSHFQILFEKTQSIIAGYKGYIYVDAENAMIMRTTRESEDIPTDFPVQRVRQSTEYEFTKIGDSDQEFLLPAKSTNTSTVAREGRKNEIRFTHYRRFGADVKFIPDSIEPEPKEKKP